MDVLICMSLKCNLNEQIIGLVVMNLGSNLPDLINAIVCSTSDVGQIGISAIFSSQVHNLLIGTSLP